MRSTWVWTAALLIVIADGSYGLYDYLRPEPLPQQPLYGNGQIQGTEVSVAAEVAGRIIDVLVVEGATVAKGDVLARLDDEDLRLRRERVKAEIEAQEQERERVALQLDVARHHVSTARTEFERNRELHERDSVSMPSRRACSQFMRSELGENVCGFFGIISLELYCLAVFGNEARPVQLLLDAVAERVCGSRIAMHDNGHAGQGVAAQCAIWSVSIRTLSGKRSLRSGNVGWNVG